MNQSALRHEFIKYVDLYNENLDQVLSEYAIEVFEFLKIYEPENIFALVKVDKINMLVNFCFYITKKPAGFKIVECDVSERKEYLTFLKNNIIIQKKLTPFDISICAAVHDVAVIRESIQKAELERLNNNLESWKKK